MQCCMSVISTKVKGDKVYFDEENKLEKIQERTDLDGFIEDSYH